MKRYLVLLILAGSTTGCAYANPLTSLTLGKTKWYSTKDVNFEAKGLRLGDVTVEELKIIGEASAVRTANVEQMNAATRQLEQARGMVETLSQLVAQVVPAIIAARRQPPATQPATQPATKE